MNIYNSNLKKSTHTRENDLNIFKLWPWNFSSSALVLTILRISAPSKVQNIFESILLHRYGTLAMENGREVLSS